MLSVAVVVTGALSFAKSNEAYAYEKPTTITVEEFANSIEVTGAGGSATFVQNKKQVASNNTFTGIRLTGQQNAVFNLGNIVLGEDTYWNGPDHAQTTSDFDTDYNTATQFDFKSFIGIAFDPHTDRTTKLSDAEKKTYNVDFSAEL